MPMVIRGKVLDKVIRGTIIPNAPSTPPDSATWNQLTGSWNSLVGTWEEQ